jgi:PmbA protein
MIGRDDLLGALTAALAHAKGEATAVAQASRAALTRYANNAIHQNMETTQVTVSFRARLGGREGVATTTGLSTGALVETLRRAEAIAAAGPAGTPLAPLPGPQVYDAVKTYLPATADFSAVDRARQVKVVCDIARTAGATAAGLLSSGYTELAVANTSGLAAYVVLTAAELMVIFGGGEGSGYAGAVSRDINEIDAGEAAEHALAKWRAGGKRVDIDPGEYEVVLEPAAVAGALEWLGYIGFGSRSIEDGTSFLVGRAGEKLVGENVTIYDDGLAAAALGVPFDFDGLPKKRHHFFDRGVVGQGVTDLSSAARQNRLSTGHALPPAEAANGALPLNVVMAPGDSDLPAMIGAVRRGILVTRFHYINGMLDTREGVLTGMTRDGTFLIEDGRVTAALRNLRFTQSFLEALRGVKSLSSRAVATRAWWGDFGACVTPALHLENFRFIGAQKES